MINLRKEISLELLRYKRKFGKTGQVLLLGEEEWALVHDEEKSPFKVATDDSTTDDGFTFDDDGYAHTLWSLTIYKTHDKSLVRVGGK